MLARRLPTILPDMTLAEAIEATKVHSVAGLMDGQALVATRPFRSPHHTISDAGLIGGGTIPKPGGSGKLRRLGIPDHPRPDRAGGGEAGAGADLRGGLQAVLLLFIAGPTRMDDRAQ